MGRLAITPLSETEKEPHSHLNRPLHQMGRQSFIACLEPVRMRDGRVLRVQIVDGMFEEVLADFTSFGAIPFAAWRRRVRPSIHP